MPRQSHIELVCLSCPLPDCDTGHYHCERNRMLRERRQQQRRASREAAQQAAHPGGNHEQRC